MALAQSYRELSRREVAERLGRDPHNLIPDTGNPKVDFVVKLAGLLDWSIEMVVDELYERAESMAEEDHPAAAARECNRRAWDLVRAERWEEATALLREVIEGRASGEAKAYACQLLVTALESQGHYLKAMQAARCGLLHCPPGSQEALRLRALLAFANYVTGALYEAEGLAGALLADLGELDRSDPLRQTQAFACFVRGHARRCIAQQGEETDSRVTSLAVADLERAISLFEDYAVRGTPSWDAGLAEIARAGVFELRALSGEIPAEQAIGIALRRLEGTEKIEVLDSTAAEALGWWCVFAANVVLRRVAAAEQRDQLMGILTNKADEVATRLGHWALRERVLTLEHQSGGGGESNAELRERAQGLDTEDLRSVAGTMSRFPEFRPIGWQILRARRPVSRTSDDADGRFAEGLEP